MNLREDLLRGIYAYGFEKPSAIQQRAIIPCIRGKQKKKSLLKKLKKIKIDEIYKLSFKNCLLYTIYKVHSNKKVE